MSERRGEPLVILAGGGSVPVRVAAAARAAGRPVFIIALKGEADPGIADFAHELVTWGQLGRIDELLAAHGGPDLVLVGSVRSRPDFKGIKLDFATMRSLKDLLAIVAGGEHDVMSGAVRFFEKRGRRIVGAHEVATDLVAAAGALGKRKPGRRDLRDIERAMQAARAIGLIDAGQAAVALDNRIIALEAAEGTDGMLERVTALRIAGGVKWDGRAGVLAKCAKPQQDLRVDMPTIGLRTIETVAAAGLAGIAIEAGRVMVVDRDKVVERADAAGLFIFAAGPAGAGA